MLTDLQFFPFSPSLLFFYIHPAHASLHGSNIRLMNKLRSGNAVRPDPREEGNKNVTRFLAACASYGLQNEDLFQLEDLTEPTSDSLARVAHTIITLIQFVETPAPSRIKWIKPPQSHHTDSSALSPPSSTSTTAAASPLQ